MHVPINQSIQYWCSNFLGSKNETMKTDLQLENRVKVQQNTIQTLYMKTTAFSYTVEPP